MSVILRNYNGVYSIFLKDENGIELIHSTRLISEANKVYNDYQQKIDAIHN